MLCFAFVVPCFCFATYPPIVSFVFDYQSLFVPHLSLLSAKRLLLKHLFPRPDLSNGKELATVDFFYKSLRRAPITFNGLPVAPSPSTVPTRMNTPIEIEPQEMEEERMTRERREAKEKGTPCTRTLERREDTGTTEGDVSCPIRSDVFAEGILTQCGHLTCKGTLRKRLWTAGADVPLYLLRRLLQASSSTTPRLKLS